MFSWLFSQPPAWFEWAASFATLTGLVIAITQLARTRKAADEAKRAALDVKSRLGDYDSAAACGAAIELILEARNYSELGKWDPLGDRFSRIRRLLIEIEGGTRNLSKLDQITLQSALVGIVEVAERIEDRTHNPLTKGDVANVNKILAKKSDEIVRILTAIRNRTGESA